METKTNVEKLLITGCLLSILTLYGFCGSVKAGAMSLPNEMFYPGPLYIDYSVPVNLIDMNRQIVIKKNNTRDRSLVFVQLYHDFRYLLNKPDFYLTIGGLGLTPPVFHSAFTHESPELTELWGSSAFADIFFESGEVLGDGAFPVLASASLWGVGSLAGSSRLRNFSSDLFRAQIVNGFFTLALKVSVKRTRPDGTPYSYPSGHTSSVFTTAAVVYKHFGIKWGIPAFIVASYVGLSRLQENKHYLSDVIAGGILGSYIGLRVAHYAPAKKQIFVHPMIQWHGGGFVLSMTF